MHGRKKSEHKSRSAAELEAIRLKVASYQQLSTAALRRRREVLAEGEDPTQDLLLSGQLLRVNPDVYTLWNHRKELLLATSKLGQDEVDQSGLDIESTFAEELGLAADCIRKNPKSYGAWYHRQWCFEVMQKVVGRHPDKQDAFVRMLDRELGLCGRFLDADERNFHCWNYRRFVVGVHPQRTAKMEFDFSTERIEKNFSNYSAFHHRSTYIRQALGSKDEEWPVLEGELELVKQAMYTEPDDQTAWWYHQFLIKWAAEHGPERLQQTLRQEVDSVRGLLEDADGEYRWAVMALASLLVQLARLVGQQQQAEEERAALVDEALVLYDRLQHIDPDHRHRYRAMARAINT